MLEAIQRRSALLQAALPFASMSVVAQLSGLMAGQLGNGWIYLVSTALLAATGAQLHLYRARRARWLRASAVQAFIASIALLILSQQPGSTGLGMLLLLPVVAASIYGDPGESVVAVSATTAWMLALDLLRGTAAVATARSVVLVAAVGAVISVACHGQRERMRLSALELRRQARMDPLTGVANRRSFSEGVAAVRGEKRYAMLSIDIDNLKSVNDSHGHKTGDELLKRVATVCQAVMRQDDLLARLGGDEFAAFIPNANLEDGWSVAHRMKAAIRSLDLGLGHPPTASIGVAAGSEADDADDVLAEADRQMYRDKAGPRDLILLSAHPSLSQRNRPAI